jgi:hypothetical protein
VRRQDPDREPDEHGDEDQQGEDAGPAAALELLGIELVEAVPAPLGVGIEPWPDSQVDVRITTHRRKSSGIPGEAKLPDVTAFESGTPEAGERFAARLDDAEVRLLSLATRPFPPGLTEPDPGGEERWDAAHVWAHLAEFPPYWVAQVRKILASPADEPVPFGRLADDAGRNGAIERDRLLPPEELWLRVRAGIEDARTCAAGLSPADRQRLGQHPRRGPVTVAFVLDQFVANHLEEHAAQLEGLAG